MRRVISLVKDEIETLEFGKDISPSDWLNKWKPYEEVANEWLYKYFFENDDSHFNLYDDEFKLRMDTIKIEKELQHKEEQAKKQKRQVKITDDISNLTKNNIPSMIMREVKELQFKIRNQFDQNKEFITQYVRRKYNKQGKVVAEAIMLAIYYEINMKNDTLYINYISRFWQGIDFQLDMQKRDYKTYERIPSDMLFKRVLENSKAYNAKVLKIQIVSEGSLQLVKRHLLPKFNKAWHKTPKIKDYDIQYFPLKYLEIPICSQCSLNIAAVAWENTSHYFCGEECARKKWESF